MNEPINKLQLGRFAKDAAYVALGLGVMGFQRSQVRRREFAKRIVEPRSDLVAQLENIRTELTRKVKDVDSRVEQVIEVLDGRLEKLEERLPLPTKSVVHEARKQAREVHEQLRNKIVKAA